MNNFVVTIARTYGSGGKTIGKAIAKELDIGYYDKEIIRLASDESGINEKLFLENDEKIKDSIFKLSPKIYKGGVISPNNNKFVSDDNLFNYQAKVIKDIAANQSCIIVGRCGDFVLNKYPNVVRVFVYAEKQHCIEIVSEKYCISKKEAEKRIETIDKQRGQYYKYYTGSQWDNPLNYDLCINTTNIDFDFCAKTIQQYLKTKNYI